MPRNNVSNVKCLQGNNAKPIGLRSKPGPKATIRDRDVIYFEDPERFTFELYNESDLLTLAKYAFSEVNFVIE